MVSELSPTGVCNGSKEAVQEVQDHDDVDFLVVSVAHGDRTRAYVARRSLSTEYHAQQAVRLWDTERQRVHAYRFLASVGWFPDLLCSHFSGGILSTAGQSSPRDVPGGGLARPLYHLSSGSHRDSAILYATATDCTSTMSRRV